MDLSHYGFSAYQMPEQTSGIPARITAAHKDRYALVCEHGEIYARLKGSAYYNGSEEFPTVGDFVLIDYIPSGDSRIIATMPRRTFFARHDPTPGRGKQAVAANFDYVFIVQSLNHNFNMNRLERYLTLAWQSGAVPAVILTKSDLVENPDEWIQAVRKISSDIGVYAVSSKECQGFDALSDYLKPGKTLVLLGSSGVGKSSLVNALAGKTLMDVREIREYDARGRHTTTHRQLIMLPGGAMIIDTPGMRELGMWDITNGLDDAFSDVKQYLGRCRFSDCTHRNEPGCAVLEAIRCGELPRSRWENYVALKKEAEYADDAAAYLQQKWQRNKKIAKELRQRQKKNR